MPDVPGGVGRLLARASRPALDPWTGPPPPITLEEIQPAPGPDSTVPERVPAPLEAPPLPEARAERTAATVTPAAEPVAPAGGRASLGPAPAAEPAAAAPAGAAGGETRPSGRPPVRR
ncbi:MAG TPA: hypothetical protein VD769_00025, partial [Gaiellaceae bacterium]|nr:hypothetical protein [Gaiellaceae bacterium]